MRDGGQSVRGKARGFFADEGGGFALWNIAFLGVIAMLGGLAVDISNAYRHRAMLQAVLDSAASAAAVELPDVDRAMVSALEIAEINLTSSVFESGAITAADLEFGVWDPDAEDSTPPFSPAETSANAVRMRMASERARGNPVSTFVLRAFGYPEFDVSVEATAVKLGGLKQCPAGFLSRGAITIKANNSYRNTCLHGSFRRNSKGDPITADGYAVSMQNGNVIDAQNSIVSMPDPSETFADAGGNVGVGKPYNENGISNGSSAVHDALKDPMLVDQLYCTRLRTKGLTQTSDADVANVDLLAEEDCAYSTPGRGLYGALSATLIADATLLPAWPGTTFAAAPETTWDPAAYTTGKRYVVEGDVTIDRGTVDGSNGWFENVMILATGTIRVEGGVKLRNAFLFSRYGDVEIAQNVELGEDYCKSGTGEVYLFANRVSFGTNNPMDGVIVAALDEITFSSNTTGTGKGGSRGISMEAGAHIALDSRNEFDRCDETLPAIYAPLAADLLAVPGSATTMIVH